jgi:putative redox protein
MNVPEMSIYSFVAGRTMKIEFLNVQRLFHFNIEIENLKCKYHQRIVFGSEFMSRGGSMPAKTARLRHVEGLSFIGTADSGHAALLDSSVTDEPTSAPSPMEMLLFALGGCTGTDVVMILKKKRIVFSGLEVIVRGERRAEHPRSYTKVHVEYLVQGDNVRPKDVEGAIDLSASKYCSVSAMFREAGVVLTHSYRIIGNSPTRESAGQ